MILSIKDGFIENPKELEAFLKLKDGKYKLSVKDFSIRSLNQNKYYWTICELLAVPLQGLWGPLSKEDVHDMMKNQFLRERVFNEDHSKSYYKIRSTTDLSITEMKEYIDKIILLAGELGIAIPEV